MSEYSHGHFWESSEKIKFSSFTLSVEAINHSSAYPRSWCPQLTVGVSPSTPRKAEEELSSRREEEAVYN